MLYKVTVNVKGPMLT